MDKIKYLNALSTQFQNNSMTCKMCFVKHNALRTEYNSPMLKCVGISGGRALKYYRSEPSIIYLSICLSFSKILSSMLDIALSVDSVEVQVK